MTIDRASKPTPHAWAIVICVQKEDEQVEIYPVFLLWSYLEGVVDHEEQKNKDSS